MKPGSSPLGETSMVPSSAVVPTSANGQRLRKSIDCSSSASRILLRVAGRGSAMMRRRSAVEVRRAIPISFADRCGITQSEPHAKKQFAPHVVRHLAVALVTRVGQKLRANKKSFVLEES